MNREIASYRPDIDGLRAIAVLLVILFHAYPDELAGGYVGVDIFFVISGYLITGIILKELAADSFSFRNFYSRRIRRIFPALIVVVVVSLVVGWFALLKGEYQQLGQQVLLSVAFVANINFWQQVGYFDAAAEKKILLHLWSLGVEEQFYFLLPVFLWIFRRRVAAIWFGIVFAFLVSLFVYFYLGYGNPASAFYLPHARFWELLAGGLLAFSGATNRSISQGHANGISIIGVAAIGWGLWTGHHEHSFAGLWSLLPVIGATALLFSKQATFNTKILSSNSLVWVGKLSYPLYLWHWVLLSFCHVFEDSKPFYEVRNPALVASFILAWLTYRYIEFPIRHGALKKMSISILVAPMLCLAVISAYIWIANGVPWRSAARVDVINIGDVGQEDFVEHLNSHSFKCKNIGWSKEVMEGAIKSRCSKNHVDERPIRNALMGDSHAEHLFIGLAASYPKSSLAYATREGLPLLSNLGFRDVLIAAGEDVEIQSILLSAHWASKLQNIDKEIFSRDLHETLKYFFSKGKRVYLFDDVPIFPFNPQRCAYGSRMWISHECDAELSAVTRTPINLDELVKSLQDLYPNFLYINTSNYFCNSEHCSMAKEGKLFYRDRNHLNILGSLYVGTMLVKNSKLLLYE